jgi:hypothetical protein
MSSTRRVLAGVAAVLVVVLGFGLRVALRHVVSTHTSSIVTPQDTFSVPGLAQLESLAPSVGVGAAYAVGDCLSMSDSGAPDDFKVDCSNSQADYKVLQIVQNAPPDLDTAAPQCFSVPGNDAALDKETADGIAYLYCLGSTVGVHSARRAEVGDCLSSDASGGPRMVDCSDARAGYVVVGRFDGTNDQAKCGAVAGSTAHVSIAQEPQVLLCVKRR